MTAKDYLQQVKIKNAEIDNLQNDEEMIVAMMYSLGGCDSGERVQSSRNNDKFGMMCSRIEEKKKEITEKIDTMIDFKLKVSGEINALNDDRYIKLLHKRYIRFASFEMIAVELGYTYQYTVQLHGDALQEFERTYEILLNSY